MNKSQRLLNILNENNNAKLLYTFLKPLLNEPGHRPNYDDFEVKGNKYLMVFRNYKFFTDRPGEEDDDFPDFTGRDNVKKIVDHQLKLHNIKPKKVDIYNSEKSYFTVEIEL